MNVYQESTIVMRTRTVPTFKDHLTVLVNMDIKEMVLIAKVCVKYFHFVAIFVPTLLAFITENSPCCRKIVNY